MSRIPLLMPADHWLTKPRRHKNRICFFCQLARIPSGRLCNCQIEGSLTLCRSAREKSAAALLLAEARGWWVLRDPAVGRGRQDCCVGEEQQRDRPLLFWPVFVAFLLNRSWVRMLSLLYRISCSRSSGVLLWPSFFRPREEKAYVEKRMRRFIGKRIGTC